LGMRGLVTLEIEAEGTKGDLHSGTHGGIAYNPNRALVEMLGKVFDKEGKITIPGFYDTILPLTKEEKESVSFDFDENKYIDDYGAPATGGEKGLKPLERNWLRPTFEINGMWGGYTGHGFKTVIPSKAYAKVSCRLVRGQDPIAIGELVKNHFENSAPAGIKIKVTRHLGGGPATLTTPNSKIVQAFSLAFEKVFKKPCKYILEGASIPIVSKLSRASGAEAVLVGVGLATDQIHAPNEHFGLERLEKGRDVMIEAILSL
ncbi:MAG: M20/M25/M40 family metallo-hydrolase, partial [Parachlamydiaceae bacterium]